MLIHVVAETYSVTCKVFSFCFITEAYNIKYDIIIIWNESFVFEPILFFFFYLKNGSTLLKLGEEYS